jgi:uncharacterized protein (TIGR02147 family)
MDGLDLIEFLNIEYERKCERNKSYSLRAYARDLDVQPATLSHILKRKRAASPEFREKIYSALKLSIEQRQYLESHTEEVFKFTKKELDIYLSLSEWYYDAITELTRTKGFVGQNEYVAQRLGLSLEETNEAVKRLVQMGLIKKMPNKKWVSYSENTITYGGDHTSFALQKLQRQLMEKAIVALETIPKKDREQASMIMAINKKDLPEAKKRIKEFQQDMCKYLQRPNRESEEVYQMITTLFPLSVTEE